MRRAVPWVLVFVLGGACGWALCQGRADRDRAPGGYPTHVEVVRPTPEGPGPGKVHRLKVVSASEDGWPVEIAEGTSAPVWRVKLAGGPRKYVLFAEEE